MCLISLDGNFDGLSLDFANTILKIKVNILAMNHFVQSKIQKGILLTDKSRKVQGFSY